MRSLHEITLPEGVAIADPRKAILPNALRHTWFHKVDLNVLRHNAELDARKDLEVAITSEVAVDEKAAKFKLIQRVNAAVAIGEFHNNQDDSLTAVVNRRSEVDSEIEKLNGIEENTFVDQGKRKKRLSQLENELKGLLAKIDKLDTSSRESNDKLHSTVRQNGHIPTYEQQTPPDPTTAGLAHSGDASV